MLGMPAGPVRGILLVPVALLLGPGCGLLSRSRLNDCARQVQALRAEGIQLKDEAFSLRARNRELAQRAIDDARRIRDLEEARRNLERSVVAYQQERDELAAAFEEVQRLVQASVSPGATATRPSTPDESPPPEPSPGERLAAFARSHPGCRYDPARAVWTFPASLLFEPGSDRPKPEAALLVGALGRILADPAAAATPTRIVGKVAPSPVRLASTGSPSPPPADLARARARKVRQWLASPLALEASAIPVEGADAIPEPAGADGDSAAAGVIEIHLKAEGLDRRP